MLRKWTLQNFKSFHRRTEIDLSPITVFAGANSSGKSSILQSILLIKQTIEQGSSDRALALNGSILRLGRFNDVKNIHSSEDFFGFNWELDLPAGEEGTFQAYEGVRHASPLLSQVYDVRRISMEVMFGVGEGPTEIAQLQPTLRSASVSLQVEEESSEDHLDEEDHDEEPEEEISLSTRHLSIVDNKDAVSLALRQSGAAEAGDARYRNLRYLVSSIDTETRSDILGARPIANVIGASISQFAPDYIVFSFDEVRYQAQLITKAIVSLGRQGARLSRHMRDLIVPSRVVELLYNKLREVGSQGGFRRNLFGPDEDFAAPRSLESVLALIRRWRIALSMQQSRAYELSLRESAGQITDGFLAETERKIALGVERSGAMSEAIRYARDYFQRNLQYLGPLRDEPKPLYPLEALARPTDVGFRGEHTAAVLDVNKNLLVLSFKRESLEEPDWANLRPRLMPVKVAVEEWLTYLGVADSVSTGDLGKFGHEMQVSIPGTNQRHDLTNVGVGVSQVLPIVVMALLAEQGNLLIFEQPELHLHPKVQARLGDFFLAMSFLGKQCILETHSEHLIGRFRRRIAEDRSRDLDQTLSVYFIEQFGGRSDCRKININRFGAIEDWPRDFFDQSSDEIERILLAASEKRRQMRSADGTEQ